jgi:hypothetical protein
VQRVEQARVAPDEIPESSRPGPGNGEGIIHVRNLRGF